MFYYFSAEDNQIYVKKTELLFVAEFADLHRLFGWNALQYMFYFAAPASPYYTRADLEQRNMGVLDSIRQKPWDAHGKRLPKRLYEDAIYLRAKDKFLDEFDDEIELMEESIFRTGRRMRMEELNKLQTQLTMSDVDLKKSENIIDYLAKLDKFHDQKKKAAKDRISTEDTPSVIFGDIVDEE